eukprot:3489918-Pleurochrysis_carterae.AAC.1
MAALAAFSRSPSTQISPLRPCSCVARRGARLSGRGGASARGLRTEQCRRLAVCHLRSGKEGRSRRGQGAAR